MFICLGHITHKAGFYDGSDDLWFLGSLWFHDPSPGGLRPSNPLLQVLLWSCWTWRCFRLHAWWVGQIGDATSWAWQYFLWGLCGCWFTSHLPGAWTKKHKLVDSRMRSKGSRFTLGVWGLRVCSLDVAFVVATVRNRSQPFARSPYGRAYGKFCRGGPFWRFQTSGCFVSRGRCGTSWHSDVFWNVSKVVLRGRRNTFATFSEDVLQFSWQAQHFGRVHRHFSWQAQHLRRAVLRVFCKSHWQGCVATRCKFRGSRCILCDVLKIDGSLARNIDFEVANFQVLRKTRRKTSILKLQSVKIGGSLVRNASFSAPTCLVSSCWFSYGVAVSMGKAGKPVLLSCCQRWKLPDVSHKMLVLLHPCVSSRVAGFPVASPCLWGKLENLSFSNVSKQVVMSFCVAGVALCDIPNLFDDVLKMSKLEEVSYEMLFFLHPRVLSRVAGFPVASLCLWGKLENMSFSNVSKQVVMSFCVAGVALCDIPNLFDDVLKMSKLEEASYEMLFFCIHMSYLESLVFLWRRRVYGRSSAPHTLHFTLRTPPLTL